MELHENGGSSQQPSYSDVALAVTVRKILEKEIEPMVSNIVRRLMKPMVTTTVQQVIVPVAEDLFRRVVKEEIQSVEEKVLAGGTRNDLPMERSLQLKFSDELPCVVRTGTELKGGKGECLKVALFDVNGHNVTCGREASAKVEIVLLDDNGNMTNETFERRIIREGENKRPHFPRSVYIYLEKGEADLTDLRLAYGSESTNNWKCRLGATLARNLGGVMVQEAWTAPFVVKDKRGKYREKCVIPSPSTQVWRLKQIDKGGERCRRLKDNGIVTVLDFLFWFSVNPKDLQKKILGVGDGDWKTIITHAQDCKCDHKKMFSHKSSCQTSVIYDDVGKLKGVIKDSHFVPIDDLSGDEKDHARKVLSSVLEASAFGERYDTSFNDEDSLLKEFPYRSSQQGGLAVSEDISGYQSTILPDKSCDSWVGELSNPASRPFPDPHTTGGGGGGGPLTDLDASDLDEHSSPTNMLLPDKDKADTDQHLLASSSRPYNDMQHSTGLGGESSSGRSNASFQSATSEWFPDERYCPPLTPDDMLDFAGADVCFCSHNARGHRNEMCGNEGSDAAAAASQVVDDTPKGWKKLSRLWFAFSDRMSIHATYCCKKRRVG